MRQAMNLILFVLEASCFPLSVPQTVPSDSTLHHVVDAEKSTSTSQFVKIALATCAPKTACLAWKKRATNPPRVPQHCNALMSLPDHLIGWSALDQPFAALIKLEPSSNCKGSGVIRFQSDNHHSSYRKPSSALDTESICSLIGWYVQHPCGEQLKEIGG